MVYNSLLYFVISSIYSFIFYFFIFSFKFQLQLFVAQQVEGHAVVGRGAVLADGFAVGGGGVALVVVPGVAGVLVVQAQHVVVAVGLGQYAGGGYVHVLGIALHHRLPRCGAVGLEAVAIHADALGPHLQAVQGAVHGQYAGVEDVHLVNLLSGDDAHGPCHGLLLDDGAQFVALALGELLAVVQPFVAEAGRQDDGSGIHRPGQAAPAGLVAASLQEILVQLQFKHRIVWRHRPFHKSSRKSTPFFSNGIMCSRFFCHRFRVGRGGCCWRKVVPWQ